MSTEQNFGDLVASIVQKKKDDAKAKSDAEHEEKKRFGEARREACAVIYKVLQQTKDKFGDKVSVFNIDSDYSTPCFYTNGNTQIELCFSENPHKFALKRNISGYGCHSNDMLIESDCVDDLIPVLIQQLALAVEHR